MASPKNGTDSKKKVVAQKSGTKQFLIVAFLLLIAYGFTMSMYNFRVEAEKDGIPMRDISDMWYIVIASLINLVSFRKF